MLYCHTKHSLNIIVAATLLVIGFPLLVVIGLAIKLESRGPIFFRQQRVGLRGKLFTIYKFRTMRTGAHNPDNPTPYVTRVGQFLRRYSLDEVPQLINILRGEMAIIGPRPILPKEAKYYDVWQRQRLQVRPGLTGWAQVNGRNALAWYERIEHDVWYVKHQNWLLDFHILARTPRTVLSSDGVYGPGNLDPGPADFAAYRVQMAERTTPLAAVCHQRLPVLPSSTEELTLAAA